MRSVLSISGPPKKLQMIKKKAKEEGLTISAYVIRIFDEGETMISEEELLQDVRQNRKDIAAGHYRIMGPGDKIEDFLSLDE